MTLKDLILKEANKKKYNYVETTAEGKSLLISINKRFYDSFYLCPHCEGGGDFEKALVKHLENCK